MSQTPRRPLSPHLQVWRWHVTMFSSIMHRVTGSASVAGIVAIAAWLVCLGLAALGHREAYTQFLTCASSLPGLVVWFGLSLAGFVHLTGGLRHLIWDLGLGFQPKNADALATWTMLLGVILTIAFWAVLFMSGKVSL